MRRGDIQDVFCRWIQVNDPPLTIQDQHSFLHLRDHGQGQGGLAGRLRAVDLGDAAARDAADPERHVELHRAGGDDGDLVERAVLAQTHDGALAELAVDRSNR